MAIRNFEFTRVAIHIAIEDDTGRIEALLTSLALLAALLTKTGLALSSTALFVTDVVQAVDFTAKVMIICVKSLAFGLGVTL